MTITEEDYTKLDSKHVRGETRQAYYWILAKEPVTGKLIILGAYESETEANQMGFSKIKSGDFEVIPLNTRDMTTASRMLKYRQFQQTEQLEEVVKRARHQV